MVVINNIIDKIIEQGNHRNFDINVVTDIEEYMSKYLRQDHNLDYELLFRFVLMESNVPLCDYERCIECLNIINKKNILE